MTRLIDISLAISSSSLAPPHADFTHDVSPIVTTAEHGVGVSRLSVTTHTGTHVDPPSHFVVGGASVDQLPLERFYGEAYVAELPAMDGLIGPASSMAWRSRRAPHGCSSRPAIRSSGTATTSRGPSTTLRSSRRSHWIAEHGIQLVGIDFLGIEPPGTAPGIQRIIAFFPRGSSLLRALTSTGRSGTLPSYCAPTRVERGTVPPCVPH